MNTNPTHISVCVCTYQRPVWLKRLLTDLGRLNTQGLFAYSVVVADNDEKESGRQVVEKARADYPVEIIYCVQPARSISLVRNMAIAQSKGDAVAFIDDDEFPEPEWLLNLYRALASHQVAGVLGPVKPHFEAGAPAWVQRGGFYDRPEHRTGFVMPWEEGRTGNVLFDKRIVEKVDPIFRPEFGTGGGDVDFFRRMMEAGHKFIWCNEAVVHEYVPPKRWNRRVLLKRALLRGRNSYRHPKGRVANVAKAVIAVPIYAVSLPFLQVAGHHLFMRYLVKLCDHTGRLLAAAGIEPVHDREM